MLLQRQVNRQVKSQDYILPAPIGGLNVRDAISAMSPQYAITMDNYMPTETAVVLRNGYIKYIKLGDNDIGVKTLAYYAKPNDERFLAAYDNGIYNISSSILGTRYNVNITNSEFQTAQYKNYLFFVNGNDIPKVYYIDDDGNEHLQDWEFIADNLNAAKIINVAVSKERLWFVEKGTLKVWYPETAGNIAGTLQSFDLSQIVKLGGELIAVANWTLDGGQGIDDLTCFITSQGEVLVYAGSNPNNAADWELKGSYRIAKPIGYRSTMKFQGDVIIITEDGYIPMGKMLSVSNSGATTNIFSDNIRGLVLKRTAMNKTKHGWQSVVYSKKGYAIFNVPVAQQFEQHVININTGAWCRFTNIRSFCWCVYGDELYFGSDNTVYKFDNGYTDNGTDIEGIVEQAYTNLGTPALKKISLINPRTKCSTKYRLTIYTNVDFQSRNVNYVANIGELGASKWQKSIWSSQENGVDKNYKWQTQEAVKINSQWVANSAVGTSVSIVFKTRTRGNKIEWYDTEMRYELGTGII